MRVRGGGGRRRVVAKEKNVRVVEVTLLPQIPSKPELRRPEVMTRLVEGVERQQ